MNRQALVLATAYQTQMDGGLGTGNIGPSALSFRQAPYNPAPPALYAPVQAPEYGTIGGNVPCPRMQDQLAPFWVSAWMVNSEAVTPETLRNSRDPRAYVPPAFNTGAVNG